MKCDDRQYSGMGGKCQNPASRHAHGYGDNDIYFYCDIHGWAWLICKNPECKESLRCKK